MLYHAFAFLLVHFSSPGSASKHSLDCAGVGSINPRCASHEVTHKRDFFYVGGRSLETETGNVTVDQVYVEKLSPVTGSKKKAPLVFFHGGSTSGVSWLNTPDNRKGWASYFLEKGHYVYLVDAYTGARSPANNFAQYNITPAYSIEAYQAGFTAPSENHTQFPGSGLNNGDPVFDAFVKAMVPWTTSFVSQETVMRTSGCKLLSLLGTPAYLISHSLGSFYPLVLSNDCPEFVKGSVNLEPATTPFWRYNVGSLGGVPQSEWGLTFSELSYDPPVNDSSQLAIESVGEDTLEHRNCYQQVEPAHQLPNISKVPYLSISSQGSNHRTFAHCIINYLTQVGGKPEHIMLEDIGIKGNGHFMHLELNNLEIAELVGDWIVKQEKKGA